MATPPLSNLHIKDDTLNFKPNQSSMVSSSSSSSSDEEFLGFFSEEWSCDTSPENIIFCGKVVSSKQSNKKPETKGQAYRSNSDSFRYMRLKGASSPSTPRSKSLPNRSVSSSCKSRWQVFMFGSGSTKFPTQMDVSDLKSRQLRRHSVSQLTEEGAGRRNGKMGWWWLVDVLGCNGAGYERDTMVVI